MDHIDDLHWWPVDGASGWFNRDQLPASTLALLGEAGRTYAPFMLANAAALAAGEDELVVAIDSVEFSQAPFKYQAKCLVWIRSEYEELDDQDRSWVDDQLDGTGCEKLLV